MLIAENAGVPAEQRDAWVREMLALNGVDATSLQIGQELILPPLSDGTAPAVVRPPEEDAAPEAGVLQPGSPEDQATNTPEAGTTSFAGSIPFVATPPRLGFHTPTPTPTSTPPTSTSTPAPTATLTPTVVPAGAHAWLTSSDASALYYYCDLDSAWRTIAPEQLQAFDSEQELLAIWGASRTKAPDSAC